MRRALLSFRLLLLAATVSVEQFVHCGAVAASEPATAPAALSRDRLDPISAAVTEASTRFRIPESWIKSVMHKESRQRVGATSPVGAMGLMQVMPGTYAELRERYGLGTDPYDIRNNVMAGTAYLREMFDRYGAPGFLAAYNAGPQRWEEHLATGRALPAETLDYVAELGPKLGLGDLPQSMASASSARSLPDKSLIFVALNGKAAAAVPSSKPAAVSTPLTVPAAVKPTASSLFARGVSAVDPPSGMSQPGNERANAATTPSSSRSVSEAVRAQESGLFVTRPSAASGP